MENENPVECAIAIVWPDKSEAPVCEMFRVDHRTMTWTSKHYSSGAIFSDAGKLHDGETARTLAQHTRSGINRYAHRTSVTFVVADLDPAQWPQAAFLVEYVARIGRRGGPQDSGDRVSAEHMIREMQAGPEMAQRQVVATHAA